MEDELHRGVFLPDLFIAAVNRHPDRPAVYLDDQVLTGAQVRDEVSRYSQALQSVGVGRGSAVSVLAKNRPEVLFNSGAAMVTGCRTTPLHPLGSLEDHAYVLDDAQIETLVYDPGFEARAADLAARVPTLKRLLSFGPSSVGEDLLALAATFEPRPLVAPDVSGEDMASMSYGFTCTASPISTAAPANSLRTSTPPSSVRHVTNSLATRFIPSRNGVTSITSAAR